MQIVTVGPKYQIVIPKEVRTKIKNFKPGKKVSVSTNEKYITINPEPQSWVEQYGGIAKEAWKGIDTTKYLKGLRNEWERKY